MSFSAFENALIIEDLQIKFSCIAYTGKKFLAAAILQHDDSIFAGTCDGNVCMFKSDPLMPGRHSLLMKKKIDESKKPVSQLLVVRELNTVVAVVDGKVISLSLGTLSKQNLLSNVKGADLVAINTMGPLFRLAVAQKKRLSLYEFESGCFQLSRELVIPDIALAIAFHGDILCIGYRREYTLLNQETGDVADVIVPCDATKPLVLLTSETDLLLAANESLGVFIHFDGMPSNRNPVPFGDHPTGLVRCGELVVALLRSGVVEVYSMRDQAMVQRIVFPRPFQPLWLQGSSSVVLCGSENQVYALRPTSVEAQVGALLQSVRVEEALALLIRTDPSAAQMRDFHAKAGFVLFADLRFDDAMSHLALSSIDPRELLVHFPTLCLTSLPYAPCHLANPVAHVSVTGTATQKPDLLAMIRRGRETRLKRVAAAVSAAAAEMNSGPIKHSTLNVAATTAVLAQDSTESQLDMGLSENNDELMVACRLALAKFLWRRRSEQAKTFENRNPEIDLACDTALLFLSVEFCAASGGVVSSKEEILPFTLPQFLASNNACLLSESETYLVKHSHYNTLALLYQSKNLFQKALEVWTRIGSGELRDADPRCKGLQESVALLSGLPDDILLWQYSEWVLRADPMVGLRVFTEPKRGVPLADEKVLAYIHNLFQTLPDPASTSTPATRLSEAEWPLVQVFLENLIGDRHSRDPKYHNQLVALYVQRVLQLQGDAIIQAQHDTSATGVSLNRRRAVDQRQQAGEEPGQLGPVCRAIYNVVDALQIARAQLLDFLHASECYNAATMLQLLQSTSLYQEIIIVLQRLSLHEDILAVYVHRLCDHEAAARYCANAELPTEHTENSSNITPGLVRLPSSVAVVSAPTRSDLFLMLLKIYFEPVDPKFGDTFQTLALQLLYEHAALIDPSAALLMLPDQLSATLVWPYLQRIIPITLHEGRLARITAGLEKMTNLESNCQLIASKSGSVEMSRDSRCAVCRKHIAEQMVFQVFPDRTAVHYHCSQQYRDTLLWAGNGTNTGRVYDTNGSSSGILISSAISTAR